MDAVKGGNSGPLSLDDSGLPRHAFNVMKFQVDHALLTLVIRHVAVQHHTDTFDDVTIHHLQMDTINRLIISTFYPFSDKFYIKKTERTAGLNGLPALQRPTLNLKYSMKL